MTTDTSQIAIIGAGPAGLIAAERLATAGLSVVVYDRKPSIGRKFLMAGRGGLNLTHSEPLADFMRRYGAAQDWLAPLIHDFTPADLREWCEGLGEPTFIGTSGRVFPKSMKASPLLRAWRARLENLGVKFFLQHDWHGWSDHGHLIFNDDVKIKIKAKATLLALGGASWPKLGSDGSWVNFLSDIKIHPLKPANCGFNVTWSDIFKEKFAGMPLKSITVTHNGETRPGEIMIAAAGVEGGAIYAISASLRDEIAARGTDVFYIDLKPGIDAAALVQKLSVPRGGETFANFLRKQTGLPPIAVNLLRETNRQAQVLSPQDLAALIKQLPITATAPFPIDRAISSAGGIDRSEIDDHMMLKKRPGVFVAGEMIDWEAPTGGYLLQATFATAVHAAKGMQKYVQNL